MESSNLTARGSPLFFNLITGIYKPASGRILFQDRELQKLKTTQISRLGVARTFQNIRLLHQLSVLENLRVVAAEERTGTFWKSFSKTPGARKLSTGSPGASAVFTQTGWTYRLPRNKSPSSLPYGDQRKLEIARALMRRP